uniref:Uncharacterized protein n=1 Tax=Rhizophora mucronata TaxID=61149 RepID=A0A2P2MJ49_RHIMU
MFHNQKIEPCFSLLCPVALMVIVLMLLAILVASDWFSQLCDNSSYISQEN